MSFKYYDLNPNFVDDGSRLAEMVKESVRKERAKRGMAPDPRAEPMDPKVLEDRADRFVHELSGAVGEPED